MKTIDLLIARFGASPSIPFEQGAEYLQYHPETLRQKIDGGAIRLMYFFLEDEGANNRRSQKAQKYLSLVELAELIDQKITASRDEFEILWEEMNAA
ncbi:pyocin activator PrtN family protein [Aliiroseovarius crassostreae]|uniref:Pyocin activator PrtN family protein n=1 Tax=Aliiroseovarius crassostreae TaxID=154981 RepID=A0A9Q9HBY8_9RHOB|nr:pyocin activator PrtN family protein [Aliiroseovarius crassostreae]UWP96471.1 pyocin activator PrtN family protein [Aliiroseovarius crassostreae]